MKVRAFLIRIISTWSFLPLLYLVKETTLKHLLLILDCFLTYDIFIKIRTKSMTWIHKAIIYGALLLISVT